MGITVGNGGSTLPLRSLMLFLFRSPMQPLSVVIFWFLLSSYPSSGSRVPFELAHMVFWLYVLLRVGEGFVTEPCRLIEATFVSLMSSIFSALLLEFVGLLCRFEVSLTSVKVLPTSERLPKLMLFFLFRCWFSSELGLVMGCWVKIVPGFPLVMPKARNWGREGSWMPLIRRTRSFTFSIEASISLCRARTPCLLSVHIYKRRDQKIHISYHIISQSPVSQDFKLA